MKNKRFLIVAMLCVVVLFSLITFVACDDNNNENNNNGDNADYGELFVDIDEEMLYKSLKGFIGYAFKNTVSDNEIITAMIDGGISSDYADSSFGGGYTGNIWFAIDACELHHLDIITRDDRVKIVFYDTEENAKTALPLIEQKLGDENTSLNNMIRAYQIGSFIVAESKEGFYDELLTYDIPDDKKDDKALEFFMDMFNKEMHGNNRQIELSNETTFIVQNGEIMQGGCFAMPANGNREKEYCFLSLEFYDGREPDEIMPEILEALRKGYFTEDSYVKTENINGKDYLVCYLQPKADIIYQENDDSCTIISIYFDGTSVNIPSEHNGKPVKKIDYFINSLEGLTDVYFDGTKAQWKEISQNSSRWNSVVVHCSDGIIENEPQ